MTNASISDIVNEIAPEGRLRVALNLANPLLAHGTPDDPQGVTVDVSRELAKALSVDIVFESFSAAGKVVEALKAGACDLAYMAIDLGRAADFAFTPAYMLIEAAYAVRIDSAFRIPDDLDANGVQIASADGAAYTQYLAGNLKHASLVKSADPFDEIGRGQVDAVAGIRQAISKFVAGHAGFRIIEQRFMEIPQGIAVQREKDAAARFLSHFVEDMKSSGMIAASLKGHGHHDAVVAPSKS